MNLWVKRGRETNYEFRINSYTPLYIKQITLGLSVIFWETSRPRGWSGGRRGCAGWRAKEERWDRGPSTLIHPWESQKRKQGGQRRGTQKQKQGSSETRDMVQTAGLCAYCLELVSMGLEHLRPFWSPQPPLRDPPGFALDLWQSHSWLVLFSVVVECIYTICM